MAYAGRTGRYRWNRRRMARAQFRARDRWYGVLLGLFYLLAMAVGAWLGFNFRD